MSMHAVADIVSAGRLQLAAGIPAKLVITNVKHSTKDRRS